MRQKLTVNYIVKQDAADAARRAAQHMARTAAESAAKRGRARIAISGGSTPKTAFQMLADPEQPWLEQIPWDRVELYWVDERCVGPDDSQSNYRMARESLLDRVPIPAANIHRIEGELDPEVAAARYESELRNSFRLEGAELPSFDLVALGMGDDGHTASLFPNTAALHELGRLAVANQVSPQNVSRVTLTWPVINRARSVFFLVCGAGKASVLRDVFTSGDEPERLPSQLIWPVSGILTLILDKAAAALLPAVDKDGCGVLERER